MLHNLGETAVHTNVRDNNEDVNMSCACVCTVVHACGYFNELDVCIAPINVFVVRGKVLGRRFWEGFGLDVCQQQKNKHETEKVVQ